MKKDPSYKGVLTEDIKQKSFNAERAKTLNAIMQKGSTPAPDDPSVHKLTDAEKEKEWKETDSKEDLEKAAAAEAKAGASPADTGPTYSKKAKEPDPSPNQAPKSHSVPVKSDKPLDELVFPGN